MNAVKAFLLTIILMGSVPLAAQNTSNTFSIQEAYERVRDHYPIAEKFEIQNRITAFNRQLNQTGRYPNLLMSASSSYQSQVTEIPFAAPGTTSPAFSKDHYSVGLDINQPIYDGGKVRALNKIETIKDQVENASIELELYKVRKQIDELFFGIILLQKQYSTLELMTKDIEAQLQLVASRVKNGLLLKGNELVLQAEIMKLEQQRIAVKSSITAGYEALGLILEFDFESQPELVYPELSKLEQKDTETIYRAELSLLKNQKLLFKEQASLVKVGKLPTLAAFARTAYSRPGLNAFDDDMQLYWMVGVKAQWNFRSWRNASKRTEILKLQQKNIDTEEDAFMRQLESALSQNYAQIRALKNQIELDKNIVLLREEVTKEKKSLLDNGVITSTEWLTELNTEHRARLELEARQIELIKLNIEYLTKKGIAWN